MAKYKLYDWCRLHIRVKEVRIKRWSGNLRISANYSENISKLIWEYQQINLFPWCTWYKFQSAKCLFAKFAQEWYRSAYNIQDIEDCRSRKGGRGDQIKYWHYKSKISNMMVRYLSELLICHWIPSQPIFYDISKQQQQWKLFPQCQTKDEFLLFVLLKVATKQN